MKMELVVSPFVLKMMVCNSAEEGIFDSLVNVVVSSLQNPSSLFASKQ